MNKLLTLRSMMLALTVSGLALGGCGSTFAMAPDAAVPFAKGEVDAAFEENGNGKMTVRVEHLGEPAKLNPSATVYVVWIHPKTEKNDVKAQNVGALKVDSDYSGELEFTTTFKNFDISITPESAADVTTPSGRDVLKATVSGS
jgi:hypothetical protein